MSKIKEYLKRIDNIAYKNNKSTFIMIIDVMIWYIFYGATLTDYLDYEFYKKSFKERRKYAVVRTQNKFYENKRICLKIDFSTLCSFFNPGSALDLFLSLCKWNPSYP